MKKTLQSLEHFIQSINNLENQNNGALPLGMRSQREIIKKQIKLTHAIIKKDPNINIINISFGEIYHIIETYRGFFDIKEITDKCKKHLKENNIKINTFLDILSYYLYDINWDIASKKHGIIRSNSIALDHYIKIPQGSIVEIYSMYEQNSGDFGIGYNIDLPLFIKHYHFNNNKPIEVNSLKELDKLKNSISFLNIETLSSEDINNYIKLSKKNNNTLFLYHTKKIKIFSTEIKEFKTDIELKLSPVYRYYPNYKKEQFRQTYLKINQIINKNEYDFAEIPYSKEGINYYKEYLDLSIIKTNQIKVEINNKIIYYFYNGKSNLKLKQKISNKFYLSKGDLISDNIYDVLNLIKKDNIIKKQLKKEISTKIDSLDKNNYKFINCNKTWRQHFFKISNFRNLLNENESIILIKSFMKNDKKRIYELKEKFHKSGIEKNINSFLLNKLWEKLILLSKYKEEFNNHIPISYYDLFKKKE